MRILLLINKDFPSLFAANYLSQHLADDVVYLGYSSAVGKAPKLDALLELQRFDQAMCTNVRDYCQGLGGFWGGFQGFDALPFADVRCCDDINSPGGRGWLQKINADLILSVRFGKILQTPVITSLPLGALNLHSGRLPNYQGVMASFWAKLAGDEELGSTLHWIEDRRIDTGAIVAASAIPNQPNLSYWYQVLQLYPPGLTLMLDAVESLREGRHPHTIPQRGKASYFTYPDEATLARFTLSGGRLFDAKDLSNFIADWTEG